MTTNPPIDEAASGPSRRTTLKRGLAIGGAAVWAIPAVQALSVTSASAQFTSAPPPPPPPPPPPTGKIISHGFLLLICGGKYYAVKVEGSSGALDSAGNQDKDYLVSLGIAGIDERDDILNPSAGMLASFSGGFTVFEGENALFITVSNQCEVIAAAVSFDGSFDNDGGSGDASDKFGAATIVGKTAYFRQSDDDD